ncbi:MAG: SH3 domain-containing protein [Anaerolineales bacterium]|nr:SH3 domain-containing protein [Anaerolineales bacterium]
MKRSYYFLILSIFLMLACSLTTAPVPSNAEVKNVNNVYLATPLSIPSTIPHTIPAACTVSAQSLNLRSCGGLNCSVIDWLAKDEVLVVHEKDQDWIKVTTPADQTGWVHSKYCGGMP